MKLVHPDDLSALKKKQRIWQLIMVKARNFIKEYYSQMVKLNIFKLQENQFLMS